MKYENEFRKHQVTVCDERKNVNVIRLNCMGLIKKSIKEWCKASRSSVWLVSGGVTSVTCTYIEGRGRQRQRQPQRRPEGALVHVSPRHQPRAAQGRHQALAAFLGLALQLG